MIRNLLISTLALTSIAITPAVAQEQISKVGDGFSIRINDLDLTKADGRAAMMRRLEAAGARICAGVTPRVSRKECVEATVNDAIGAAPFIVRQAAAASAREGASGRLAAR